MVSNRQPMYVIQSVMLYTCNTCSKAFESKDKRKFCSHSCSAKTTNKLRKILKLCKFCGNEISARNIFCSNKCQGLYQINDKIVNKTTNERTYKKWLLYTFGHKCSSCENTHWLGVKIPIELDHIDGNHKNNNLENLRLLCPNCHAITPTYKSKNKGNGREARRNGAS